MNSGAEGGGGGGGGGLGFLRRRAMLVCAWPHAAVTASNAAADPPGLSGCDRRSMRLYFCLIAFAELLDDAPRTLLHDIPDLDIFFTRTTSRAPRVSARRGSRCRARACYVHRRHPRPRYRSTTTTYPSRTPRSGRILSFGRADFHRNRPFPAARQSPRMTA